MQSNNRQQFFIPPTNPMEKLIKTEFYNAVASNVFESDYSRENLNEKLRGGIELYIHSLLARSNDIPGVKLHAGMVVTLMNCPENYKALFGALINLKNNPSRIQEVISGVMALKAFEDINPTNYLLTLKGYITTEQIRDTFYSAMFEQTLLAVEGGWVPKGDIEDEESDIYLSLPGLTLLSALLNPRNANGIVLIDGNIVTDKNCPLTEDFPLLVASLLALKNRVSMFTPEQVSVVKYGLTRHAELPAELIAHNTAECKDLISKITGMSIQISQRKAFQNMGQEVLDVYLGREKPCNVEQVRLKN
jgi:hypothetical protein